jgi:hypothetical protein
MANVTVFSAMISIKTVSIARHPKRLGYFLNNPSSRADTSAQSLGSFARLVAIDPRRSAPRE